MQRKLGLGLWCVFASLGCSSKDLKLETSAEFWCDGLCRAEHRCGDARSSEVCLAECVADRPRLANYSVNGAKLLGQCIAGLSCQIVYDDPTGWDAALDSCWDQAKTVVEPTPHVRSFCAQYTEALFECGSWRSTVDCENSYARWADGVLDRVAACMARPTCEQFDRCVTTTFETL